MKNDLSCCSSGRCRNTPCYGFGSGQSFFIENRMQQFVEFFGITAFQRRLFVDISLAKHVHGNFNHRATRAFSTTSLKQPKFSVLNGKLQILHIFEIIFQFLLYLYQLFCTLGHTFFQGRIFCGSFFFRNSLLLSPATRSFEGYLLWRTYTCHDVFALRVDQIFAIKNIFAGGCIARKGHTRSGCIPHIAIYHGLHVDGGSPFFGDIVHFPIEDSTLVHPTVENCTNRTPKLIPGIFGKIVTGTLFNGKFESLDKFFQIFCRKFGVVMNAFRMFYFIHDFLKRINIFFSLRFQSENNISVHLNESTIGIPRKTSVTGFFCDTLYRLVIQAQIENRIHHSGHRNPRP
ncbi:MAG: hypothetical protein BWZ06_00922 [Bacteroidetes bacterium ADurb.BinA261]|nr:MAG: hypothetical protein BWZ06_00922 [Bacteroidetes bacterium ADurb.BinA261]